ncbi:MAG: 30S ribosomal protein S8 [Candidatus Omnitrophica bacterium CG11_big_fil_rev_8_21_14_0_20_64_10]|nr:MAG: 30S ribosomal protein S8 [Candidatus Omnitrophica bacterium CG11_big_fil_rev_8_21_14_0_20_64_10]
MSLSDPIANFLTSVQNASRALKPQVDVPASRLSQGIAECLKQEGFIQNWRFLKEGSSQGVLRIYLKYTADRKPILQHVRRISRPGRRIYVRKTNVPRILSGIGMAILSTPGGVVSDAQARASGTGGEMICHVW